MINNKQIHIHINNRLLPTPWNSSVIPSSSPFQELVIELDDLYGILEVEINKHVYEAIMPSSSGVALVGADVITHISNMKNGIPFSFISDLSNSLKYRGYGVILSGSAMGVTLLSNRPNLYKEKVELSDRERLSQAHLEAVSKLIAQVGLAQKGEYRDGWMACLRQICLNLGIDVPSIVPFEGMGRVLSNEQIIDKINRDTSHA